MTNEQIQEWIENNMYHEDGTPMIDVQTFYEGAKWYRDYGINEPENKEKQQCKDCKYFKSERYHDMMWCRDCQQKNHFEKK